MANKYDGGIGTATSLLSYYMKTAFEAAGLNWSSDNDSEVEQMVEAIINASKPQ